jgi:NAD(P)-dependent dehydrogenase (short-subunit alcohol dehydrogenase family)
VKGSDVEIDLTGRVVLVTGGNRGVGLGIADAFRDAGAIVVTCSRHDAEGDHLVCDVRDSEAVQDLIDGIVERHGRLDVLVNNAGGAPNVAAAEASPNLHAKIVDLNLLSPLALCQAAYRVMGPGSSIVNVSSLSAIRPSPGAAAYGAAKAGIDSLTRTLAMEWAPRVRVNAMNVGIVETEQAELHYGGREGMARIIDTVAMARFATPRDVGNVAVFLASDLAAYVSGSSVTVHGGGETPAYLLALNGSAS